jgi:hypothetical protein
MSADAFIAMMSATAASDAELIIKRSLEREIGLLDMKIRLAEEEIREFEQQYEMNSQEFMSRFEKGELGDSQDFFEWWGLLRGKDAIADEIKKAKAVLSL